MICTVTLNPAYDKTVEVQDLIPHETNPILTVRFDPGGKGINVSRVIHEMGYETKALGIIGGDPGLYIKHYLEKRKIKTNFVEINQSTRTNLTIIDIDDPPATELNEPGPKVDEIILKKIEKTIIDSFNDSSFFVFAGSLPRGCPDNTYCRFIKLVREKGFKSVLDTRDKALVEGLKMKPFMIKPNASEAAQLLGKKVETIDEVARACQDFYNNGIKVAVISLGQYGAVMACDDGIFKATPPKVKTDSAVGAGDSMVAGVCIGLRHGKSYSESLSLGAAAGAATATTPGTSLCQKETVEALFKKVKIEKIG